MKQRLAWCILWSPIAFLAVVVALCAVVAWRENHVMLLAASGAVVLLLGALTAVAWAYYEVTGL